ncbi:MAG: squalene synthase HpnC [Acidobacteria bacterium]|nr:squalene synthase HpnC [Acidobacteriota bacterium]
MRLAPKDFVRSPEALAASYSLSDAQAYARWLATSHYENFHVASFFLPRRLHQDFFNVYSFCRWADDLGDEIGGTQESLRLLAWWREQLQAMYRGECSHPVFVALRGTVDRHGIPIEPLNDLILAFEQDQVVTRYRTWEDLFDYCRRSANPVGRLVLYLCGYQDPERRRLSDSTCTALQLANFWQDVGVDLEKDRIYVPLETLERHGSSVEEVQARRATAAFRAALHEAVDRAEGLFREGLPLARMLSPRLSLDIALFSRGGMLVLEKIRRQDYDVFALRPYISKGERFRLLLRTLVEVAVARAA